MRENNIAFKKDREYFEEFLKHTTQKQNALKEIVRGIERHTNINKRLNRGEVFYILESGGGSGDIALPLIKKLAGGGGYKKQVKLLLFNMDPSEEELELSKIRTKEEGSEKNIEHLLGCDENRPLQSGKLNVVISSHVLYYIPNIKDAIESMYDLIRDDGVIVITIGEQESDLVKFRDEFLNRARGEKRELSLNSSKVREILNGMGYDYTENIIQSRLYIPLFNNQTFENILSFILRKHWKDVGRELQDEIKEYLNNKRCKECEEISVLTLRDSFFWITKGEMKR